MKNELSEALGGNRASRLAVAAAAYISALFLALLCDLFYNEWMYQRESDALAGVAAGGVTPLTVFTLLVLAMVSLSLALIIRGVFAVSMNERVRRLGVLASVGATPRQLRARLLRQAVTLCAVPVLLGGLTGVALGYATLQAVNAMAADMAGRRAAVWQFHPLTPLFSLALAGGTVLLAAWLPARKLSKISPLAAIRYAGEPQPRRAGRFPLLSRLFGVEGELAGNALRARKKALRTATLSLTLAFLGFTLMLCFLTLSDISTNHTYFERYQGVWDVMLTLRSEDAGELSSLDALRALEGVRDVTAYRKASALTPATDADFSDALGSLGGLEALTDEKEAPKGEWLLQTPLIILDDQSFLAYCQQAGGTGRLDGAVVLNRVWDSAHSGFRYREYVPFLKEGPRTLALENPGQGGVVTEIPVLAYADTPPLLREEYEDYALPLFLPLSLWRELFRGFQAVEPDTTLRLLAREPTLDSLNALEESALRALGTIRPVKSENRLREKQSNAQTLQGYTLLLGGLCGLLAVIGLANVFTFTLSFLYQRKRELARYQSLGMTPTGIKRLFAAEALLIAGRPLLITLPLTAAAVSLMIRLSDLNPAEFWVRAPYAPVAAFALAIFAFVGLAYFLGGRKTLREDWAEALRED